MKVSESQGDSFSNGRLNIIFHNRQCTLDELMTLRSLIIEKKVANLKSMVLEILKLTLDSYVLVTFEMREKSKIKEYKNYMHSLNLNKKMPLKAQGHLSEVTLKEQHFCVTQWESYSLVLRSEIQ